MAHDLRLRLFLTYCGVSLAALILLGSIFTAVLVSSAKAVHFSDMRAETSSLAGQLDQALATGAEPAEIQRLIQRDSMLLSKRIILLNQKGQPRFDSARSTPFSRGSWRLVDVSALRRGRWARLQGGGRVGLQSPLLIHGRAVGAVALVVTATDTGIPWSSILPSLLRASAALLLVWLVFAVGLARSVSRPLRHVSAGMLSVKDGNYDRQVPEAGWSEARILARRYNEMVAEVARSRQAQQDFVANAAHELKTPVALVDGFARALADGTAARGGAVDDAVDCIRRESGHLARIVEQLFALARLDADAGALTRSPCSPADIIGETVTRFRRLARDTGITITANCAADVPVCLWDEEWVAAALANVLSNALDHSGGSEVIEIRASRDGPDVIVEVKDSGSGIPAGDLPHIFERFYRGARNRGGGHAGLGLSLVREIAEIHGGSVRVDSPAGQGALFTLRLPIDTSRNGPRAEAETAPRMTA